jgi:hypothetical protein
MRIVKRIFAAAGPIAVTCLTVVVLALLVLFTYSSNPADA